jgi:DNA-3-methyladenine glycosylase I
MRPIMPTPIRCSWCGSDPQYVAYHDEEWGVPVRDGSALFAKLTLDLFQSGLSWLIVLRKRAAFYEVMDGLCPQALSAWDEARVEQAMQDASIIRNRAKIEATVNNARCLLAFESAGHDFASVLWSHVGDRPRVNAFAFDSDIPARTPQSVAMAKSLKAIGFKWTGPTVCYAFMQAVGMINDHVTSCHRYHACG